ncbi:DNA polymerase III subunit alpha [Bacillus sp. V3B]|uniref:DNA polymerase III subunit alpha n=1 Tax=Bacillus sp. V3B TaxID=2804915 RepID=UPI00210C657A|nr:DNA polymerase III subunit alpha [Bacillus sp. V3B]MCQ6273422.1 DNA polymerase III subunit alpha [Bacillus sp. V3B]
MSFIHLHVYSAYSLLTSTASVEKLVIAAKEKGYKALAITDRNVMYGAVDFYKECIKHSIKPIIGVTVDVLSEEEERSFPLVFLAKNQKGFQNLLKITSSVQTKSMTGIPIKWLKHYSEGLFALTPGFEGEIEQALMNEEMEKANKVIRLYQQLFGGSFYISLQNHHISSQEALNNKLFGLANNHHIKLVASNQVFYLHKEDAFAHECFLAIKNGDKLQSEERERLESDEYYLKTPEEMTELFPHIPDALENTLKIAEACNVTIELHKTKLPKFPTEEGKTAEILLEEKCWQGFYERYPTHDETMKNRLQYELSIIKKMQFSDYFLIVWDFMRFAREAGILTGPGRGSAAGSLVAYTLYITDVDPIKHQLIFERFLNPERITMPDIDIDFPDHRREEVIQYVVNKYGQLHVAQIITFGTLAAKAALRDVGRVFGLNTIELDRLSRTIPTKPGITLQEAYSESRSLQVFVKESDQKRRLFETALKLEGLPRHTSTHAAGVVISEQPLVDVIPIQQGHDQIYLTQYSMEHLEELGLLKIDFLGLRNLSLIESILKSISRKTSQKLNIKMIPMDDEATYQLISLGQTTGVFQLESEGMRSVLRRLQPTCFEDIVAVNALYRPGPMENIPHFIDRKHGYEKVVYPHPHLRSILENTYGVIVYQEQIIQIASAMAGFTLGEADLLRRAVSKKQKEVLDREREHFIAGAEQKGYERKTADDIYDLIVRFANYGFNRSHAVAYSFIAYQLAYLKAHYPIHFMAAILTSVTGNDGKIDQYIRELKLMNISILPPSISKSGYSFLPEKDGVRYSLGAIKGVGVTALKEIFRARKEKSFVDLFDFCIRVSPKNVNRKTLEALIYSGSFDEFGEDRAVLLASMDVALDHAQLVKPNDGQQGDLFSGVEFTIRPKYSTADPMEEEDKLRLEKEVLGFYLSNHPVSVYEKFFSSLHIQSLYDLTIQKSFGKAVVYIGEVKKIRTKKGEQMAFLTISDQGGEMEAVVFPNVYKKNSSILQQGNVLVIEGKIEERQGKIQFIIKSVHHMEEAIGKNNTTKSTLFIKITAEQETVEKLQTVKGILERYPGTNQVIIYYEHTQKSIRLEELRVDPNKQCIDELKKVVGNGHVFLK